MIIVHPNAVSLIKVLVHILIRLTRWTNANLTLCGLTTGSHKLFFKIFTIILFQSIFLDSLSLPKAECTKCAMSGIQQGTQKHMIC